MVCNRCKMVVKSELEKLGLHPIDIELGEVEIKEENIDSIKFEVIKIFKSIGFELIDDKKVRVIEQVKNLIIELVHQKNNDLKVNISNYLSQHLNQEYKSISALFSAVENQTIEQFFIKQKIEKVKELLIYDELTLSQIAYLLNYSSVAYLSNQFKRGTGFTTSFFKQLKSGKRTGIDRL